MGPMLSNLGTARLAAGKLAEAADLAARGARRAPNHSILVMLAAATAMLVDDAAAAAHWRTVALERRPDASVDLFRQAVRYGDPRLEDTVCRAMRQAGFPE